MSDPKITGLSRTDADYLSFTRDANTLPARRVTDEVNGAKLDLLVTALTGDAIVWQRFGPLTISAGATLVVDTNLLSSFSRLDYILNFKDNPITVTKSLRLITNNNAGTITDTVSDRQGGAISLTVAMTDDAVDAFLEITNNELFDVELTFLRAITP